MNTHKSKLASEILKVVKDLFNGTQFQNSPDTIWQYVCWALKPDSPTYYKSPTSQGSKVPCDALGYQVCQKFLPSSPANGSVIMSGSWWFPPV